MKTTIYLADDLAISVKKRTANAGISMRAAIHEALRNWLKTQPPLSRGKSIQRDIGLMTGQGLTPGAATLSWEQLRELSYGSLDGSSAQ